MATHSRILAREIPRTQEPGGYSSWGCTEWGTTEYSSTGALRDPTEIPNNKYI